MRDEDSDSMFADLRLARQQLLVLYRKSSQAECTLVELAWRVISLCVAKRCPALEEPEFQRCRA
jgi:hypothetical protein